MSECIQQQDALHSGLPTRPLLTPDATQASCGEDKNKQKKVPLQRSRPPSCNRSLALLLEVKPNPPPLLGNKAPSKSGRGEAARPRRARADGSARGEK